MRLGVGEIERGILGPLETPRQTQGFHWKRRQRFTEGERRTVTGPKTNGYRDGKGRSTGKLRAMARSGLRECGQSAAEKRRGERDRRRRAPGSSRTHSRVRSPGARKDDVWRDLGLGREERGAAGISHLSEAGG